WRTLYRTCDSDGRLSAITGLLASAAYHPSGQAATYMLGNGRHMQAAFDSRARPLSLTTNGVVGLSYTYDGVGNLLTYNDSAVGTYKSMTYDALDRLVSAQGPWGGSSFAYDALGNRTQKIMAGAVTNYGYSSDGRLISATGAEPATYAWDAVGNL